MTNPTKTRNSGTMTEAQFLARLRSSLRRTFRFDWQPAKNALQAASRPYTGKNKRSKREFQCAHCGKWFLRAHVEVDHVVPCGSMKRLEDIPAFIERLCAESVSSYQVLCADGCHKKKTAEENAARKAERKSK